MLKTKNFFVSFTCAIVIMALTTSFVSSAPICNNKEVKAAAGDCGSPTGCPAWSGPGSCTGFMQVSQPRKAYCGAGSSSTYCVQNGATYTCTKQYRCIFAPIPNPNHDPNDPDSPHTLDACGQGAYHSVASTSKVATTQTCEEPS
ncbi:hypothetical protein [Gimesia aquarii]|uniref:Secreted protein n=1 Tax=Gimesia aquarii TaxID=2527964 RepID=A0A517WU06_9PLAN|nr:hypothetical protein [Gimesia aquarii]QDU08736.1 hypothetical protein V202x_21060 [Gimesia aquarii]